MWERVKIGFRMTCFELFILKQLLFSICWAFTNTCLFILICIVLYTFYAPIIKIGIYGWPMNICLLHQYGTLSLLRYLHLWANFLQLYTKVQSQEIFFTFHPPRSKVKVTVVIICLYKMNYHLSAFFCEFNSILLYNYEGSVSQEFCQVQVLLSMVKITVVIIHLQETRSLL